MDEHQSLIEALQLFNEKAEKLENLSFVKQIRRPDSGVTFRWNLNQDTGQYEEHTEFRGPTPEAADAFLLTLRFFIQDNERSSLRNLSRIYNSTDVDSDVRSRFIDARQKLNTYLDTPSSNRYEGFDGPDPLTRRQILEVFLYGDLAHANDQKRGLYRTWTQSTPISVMMKNDFYVILDSLLRVISFVRALNVEILVAMGQQGNSKD